MSVDVVFKEVSDEHTAIVALAVVGTGGDMAGDTCEQIGSSEDALTI